MKAASGIPLTEIHEATGRVAAVATGSLSASSAARLLRKWREEALRLNTLANDSYVGGDWSVSSNYRTKAGLYDWLADDLEREIRRDAEAANVRQPTENAVARDGPLGGRSL